MSVRLLALSIVVVAAGGCGSSTGGRYEAARDPGSRRSWKYVRERETGRWMNRACELRVSVDRPLPDPLQDEADGTRLVVQLLGRRSAGSGGLVKVQPELRDGYRVWRIVDVPGEDDLAGAVSYSVSLRWPQPGHSARWDAAEIFRIPPPGDAPPNEWSGWRAADDLRDGAFGWWSEVQGAPREPVAAGAHPFEMRCRLVPADVPGVVS